MTILPPSTPREYAAELMRTASKSGLNRNTPSPANDAYVASCSWYYDPDRISLVFTRDEPAPVGPQSTPIFLSWHLAVFRLTLQGFSDVDPKTAARWASLMFGPELPRVRRVYLNPDESYKRKHYHYILQVVGWDDADPCIVTPGDLDAGSVLPGKVTKDPLQ
jgi:hypothetical protein